MRKTAIIIFIVFSSTSFAQQKQVCFTLDDLPTVSYGITDSIYQLDLIRKIVTSLNNYKVPAIGFVNESKLYENQTLKTNRIELLKYWLANGLDLGNHTFSHPDYNTVSFTLYTEDIVKGEATLKKLLTRHRKTLTYFRHPYLHVGNTKAKSDSLNEFLLQHQYVVAPVTIDNDDYVFALAYKKTLDTNDTTLAQKIGNDYIEYMKNKILYYENLSNLIFGRNISQILLLHASLLNADYMDELIELFRQNTYSFISIDKSLRDPAYQTEITVYGNWGISWIERWALSMGNKSPNFSNDPSVPEYIHKIYESKKH